MIDEQERPFNDDDELGEEFVKIFKLLLKSQRELVTMVVGRYNLQGLGASNVQLPCCCACVTRSPADSAAAAEALCPCFQCCLPIGGLLSNACVSCSLPAAGGGGASFPLSHLACARQRRRGI